MSEQRKNERPAGILQGVFAFQCLQLEQFIGQCPQLPPQDDRPFFLSRIMTLTTAATTAASPRVISMVARFAEIQANMRSAPFCYLRQAGIFSSRRVASEYFLKNSIQMMSARNATAKIRPITLTCPVNRPPNWLIISAMT